jgi:hypothetical protein
MGFSYYFRPKTKFLKMAFLRGLIDNSFCNFFTRKSIQNISKTIYLIRAFDWCVNCGYYLQSWFLNKLQFDLDQRPDSIPDLVKKRNVEHFYERSENVMLSFSFSII